LRVTAFSVGVAAISTGAVLVAPVGRVLAMVGLLVAAASAWPSERRGRVVTAGAVLGLAEATFGIGVIIWWSQGHHMDLPLVASLVGAIVVVLLGYIAWKVHYLAKRG
jgi:hypothetical protein